MTSGAPTSPCCPVRLLRKQRTVPAGCRRRQAGSVRHAVGPARSDGRHNVLASLDAVLLFSLQAARSRRAGRSAQCGLDGRAGNATRRGWPVRIAGRRGRPEQGLSNCRMLRSSSKHSPKGGFGAALLGVLPGEGDAKTEVFNTGDLVVTKLEAADGRAGYWVDYGGQRAVLQPCSMDPRHESSMNIDAFTLGLRRRRLRMHVAASERPSISFKGASAEP
jgi:hypothetical protein